MDIENLRELFILNLTSIKIYKEKKKKKITRIFIKEKSVRAGDNIFFYKNLKFMLSFRKFFFSTFYQDKTSDYGFSLKNRNSKKKNFLCLG